MTSPKNGVLVTARARTDLGRTRDHNEDAFLVADLTTRTTDLTNGGPHRVGERGTLFLVADGMGGAAAGELASSMAADLIFRHLVETWDTEPNPSHDQFVPRSPTRCGPPLVRSVVRVVRSATRKASSLWSRVRPRSVRARAVTRTPFLGEVMVASCLADYGSWSPSWSPGTDRTRAGRRAGR